MAGDAVRLFHALAKVMKSRLSGKTRQDFFRGNMLLCPLNRMTHDLHLGFGSAFGF
jgi:hypothetical protein